MTKEKFVKLFATRKDIVKKLEKLRKEKERVKKEVDSLESDLVKFQYVDIFDNIPVRVFETVDGYLIDSPIDGYSRTSFVWYSEGKYLIKYFNCNSEKFISSSPMNRKHAFTSAARWIDTGVAS